MTAVRIDLTSVPMTTAGIAGWAVKADALAALAALRERGRNAERNIQIHHAHNRFFRFWVIARPDDLAEMTLVMTPDGSWARGRLYDGYLDQPARWEHMPAPEPIPATITHNYGYSAGTCGLADHNGKPLMSYAPDGRAFERTGWLASAWCVACVWKTNGSTESEVRARARGHRNHPGSLALR